MSELEVRELSKTYGTGDTATTAIADVSFDVRAGEFLSIVGPSGCGKTTLLKCVSGLLRPTGGMALLEGRAIEGPPEGLALVFQDYSRSLMPWMSVGSNVTLPLLGTGISKAERQARCEQALEEVGIPDVAKKYPWQLSGGMQQRVAIARALAYRPRVLLMDEPFASVDAQTRSDLEDLVLRVQPSLGITVVLVTHDIDEAVYVSSRVVVLTQRPTTVRAVVDIDLPVERDQVATKELPEFAQLRSHVLRLVRRDTDAVPAGEPRSAVLGDG